MRYGIALDIGTSGMRCQILDLDTEETLGTAITEKHPIPGMNVIDHVNFAIKAGKDVANRLMIETANNMFTEFGIDLSKVEVIAVCGNPFQLSLFQNIEIRDLAYAGKNMIKSLGIESPPRDGDIVNASSLGLKDMPDAKVVIPPAVTHEIGADAIAMMLMTNILKEKEPCIVVDYGTNAEMALVRDGNVYTGSAAAGPALEGQEIECGMLAAPGAISDIEITDRGWRCYVLDDTIANMEGDMIDPVTGKVIEEGAMHGKAVGITGTGVIVALANGIKTGIIIPPKIETPDGRLHLQDGISISERDVEEAGKAIGALRAGFLTLLNESGLWVDDVKKAYMSGASGLYVDARKAQEVGMVTPGATEIVQLGNTSISMARRIVLGEIDLEGLKVFAKKLRATHCMFATSEFFKNVYSIEFSLWCSSMPMDQYNPMMEIYGLKPLPPFPDPEDIRVTRLVARDLPDTEKCKVKIIKCGTELTDVVKGCIGCRKCVKACPENAIDIVLEGMSQRRAVIQSDRCAGVACRRCEGACPEKVLHMMDLKLEFVT